MFIVSFNYCICTVSYNFCYGTVTVSEYATRNTIFDELFQEIDMN